MQHLRNKPRLGRTGFIAATSLLLVVGAACGQRKESATTPTATAVTAASTSVSEPKQPGPPTTTPDRTIAPTTAPAPPTAEQFTLDGVKLQLALGTGFTLLEPTQTGTYINGGSYEFRRYRHQFADNTGGESASIALQPEDDPFLKDILELPGLDDGTAEQRVEGDGRCFFRFKRIGDRIVGVGFAEASAESADRLMAAIRDAK